MELFHYSQMPHSRWPWTAILLFLIIKNSVTAISTVEATQTISVRNGSSSVIIDCPYKLDKDNDTDGLVVKWFYNNKPFPVYQWIPGNSPQDFGIMTNRVDKSYEVSIEKHSRHRALAIIEPTIDMSGIYTCWVSNFNREIKMVAHLHVYVPASNFFITTNTSDERNSLLVSCRAEGLFPKPDMDLYRIKLDEAHSSERDREVLDEENENLAEDGTHVISLEREFLLSELDSFSEFICRISISNTDYVDVRKTIYYLSPQAYGSGGSSSVPALSRSSLICWFLLNVSFVLLMGARNTIS